MPVYPLPRPQWPSACFALADSLGEARRVLFQRCRDALDRFSTAFPRQRFAECSPTRHEPYLTVGQLTASSYLIWKRAYVTPLDHRDFIRHLWAQVLGEHFAAASGILDRLALESPTRFEQLLSLFTGFLDELPVRDRRPHALLLVSCVGVPLVETSFQATARVFGDADPPRVTFHAPSPTPGAPLFDSGLISFLRAGGAPPAG